MEFRVLAIGDVVGENGLACLARRLRPLKREKRVDFTVVNGENAAGLGLFPAQAEEILDAGADVITLGMTCRRTIRNLGSPIVLQADM